MYVQVGPCVDFGQHFLIEVFLAADKALVVAAVDAHAAAGPWNLHFVHDLDLDSVLFGGLLAWSRVHRSCFDDCEYFGCSFVDFVLKVVPVAADEVVVVEPVAADKTAAAAEAVVADVNAAAATAAVAIGPVD